MTLAKDGDTVKVNYTGKLTDGTVFDSSEGRDPLQFTIGKGQVISGFEEAIVGMTQGDRKSVTIPVDKAYGPRNDELVITVPKTQFPEDITPEVGQKLQMGGPGGQLIVVEVVEILDEKVRLDANPPLAGKDLVFDMELVEVG